MVFRDHTRRRRRLSSGSGARRPANGPALSTNGAAVVRSGKWLEPGEALQQKGERGDVLTTAQVIGWRERGFALVDGGVFPRELLAQAREDALAVFPSAGSDAADAVNDFGSSGKMEFSTSSAAVNDLTLHPRLLRAVAQLLGLETTELRLTQSVLWPKYGRAWKSGGEGDNTDQRMHVDYPNHTLVHPPPWNRPEAVEASARSSGGTTVPRPRRIWNGRHRKSPGGGRSICTPAKSWRTTGWALRFSIVTTPGIAARRSSPVPCA